MLPRVQPINPSRIAAPFDDPDWVFELKHDGFRAVAYIEDGGCQLVSRKSITYKSFPGVCTALAGLKVHDAIFDGELVCLDNQGRSQFNTLMRRRSRDVLYYVFDCLWLDGQDLRPLGLMHRKRVLRLLNANKTAGIFFADYVEESGVGLYTAVCERDCEGVIAKHKVGPYTSAPMSWFKVLNPNYSQKRGRREMFDKFRERQRRSHSDNSRASDSSF